MSNNKTNPTEQPKNSADMQRLFTDPSPCRRGGVNTYSWRNFFKVHPAAEVFPMMLPDELSKLAADIEANGLQVPIQTRQVAGDTTTYVVDGRNRLEALESLGWQIVSENGEWMGVLACPPGTRPAVEHLAGRTHAEVAAEVIGLNIRRRHLSKQKQVELIAKVLKAGRTDSAMMAGSVKRDATGRLQGSTKDEHKAEVVRQAAKIGISLRTVERVLPKTKPAKPAKPAKPRKPKPEVDRLAPEYITKRFGMFLKHWPSHAHQRKVREYLREWLKP